MRINDESSLVESGAIFLMHLLPSISRLLEIVLDAGAVQGFFLALLLTTGRNGKRTSNKILAALLVVLSVSIVHSLLAAPAFHSPYKIREPFILFIGPLLNFYIYELTGFRKIAWKDALHFLPFVLLILFLLPTWTSGASRYAEFLSRNAPTISKVIWTLIVLQYACYWWNIQSALRKHRTAVESEFSNLEGKTLSWLKLFIHVFGGFLLLLVLTLVIAFHTTHYDAIGTIVCFGLTCAIFVLGYNGLFQGEISSNVDSFRGRDRISWSSSSPKSPFLNAGETLSGEANLSRPLNEMKRVEKSRNRPNSLAVQTTARNDELLQKLKTYLEEKKPYLNEGLTLTELASRLGMTRNQLSSLINNAYGENFYSFINKYRVEEVKRLIADPKNANFTILSLAYEAGFSSKSSFHSVFKKYTGLTPTEYREKLR